MANAHPTLAKPLVWINLFTGMRMNNMAQLPLADVLGNVGAGGSQLPFAVLVPADAI